MTARLTKFDGSTGIMRPAIFVTILLLMPLAQGLGPSLSPELAEGREEVLVLDEGVWSQELWTELHVSGYTPLRMLSPEEVLVWSSSDADELDGVEKERAPEVEYKGNFAEMDEIQEFRLVFEPRLPSEAVEQIVTTFASYGMNIESEADYYSSIISHVEVLEWRRGLPLLLSLDGLLWIEPVLPTTGRNEQVGSLLQHGSMSENPAWDFGLNGGGVVVAVADSGIDADHACFRNATAAGERGSEGENLTDGVGTPGPLHRKILFLNQSIDSSDTPGHSDYRHGTHVAGTLSCHNVYDMRSNSLPQNGSSLSYASNLLFQDIVSEDGWVPPDVDALLVEAGLYGATLHSNSWGDATTAYTARTGDFDAWALEMPWSLAFIAPGNNGGQLLEPSNGRNVVAVGASIKSASADRWSASSVGPTESGTNGIFALAVGSSVESARADGVSDSYNDALRSSSGTSMATPAATSVAALIQQMIEQGWISGKEMRTLFASSDVRPEWADKGGNLSNNVSLAEGFSPSGALIRALMSLAVTPLPQDVRNGGGGGFEMQNEYDGWGQLNLSELIDFNQLEQDLHQGNVSPAENIWIHDSYRLQDQTPQAWLHERQGGLGALENLAQSPWNGSGAVGPFLKSGDVWVERFDLTGDAFNARLAWTAAPEPHLVDDLQLIVRLSNGQITTANVFQSDGDSTLYNSQIADFSNITTFPMTNETTVAVSLSQSDLEGVEWAEIEVRARYISPGNQNNSVGIDGNRVGFALAVQGVQRDSDSWDDGDGDGVPNSMDGCPNQFAAGWDLDEDGCIDDTDGDSIGDNLDLCPNENAEQFDGNADGCIDDTDGDGVYDDVDECFTSLISLFWPVDTSGCRPVDALPAIDFVLSPEDGGEWYDTLLVQWIVEDDDGDQFDTGAEIHVLNDSSSGGSYSIASCFEVNVENGTFSCTWYIPRDLPVWDIRGESLQIEIYAQSRNNSPEAKNDVVILRDDAMFTSNWNNPLLDEDKITPPSEEGAASQNRAFVWGVVGILAGFVLMYQLSWNIREKKEDEKVLPAFESSGVWQGVPSGDENE
tara:strand:+ start:8924 stop:12103 length:3180 start_codon:yes stop_codon:yes gene_type:complete